MSGCTAHALSVLEIDRREVNPARTGTQARRMAARAAPCTALAGRLTLRAHQPAADAWMKRKRPMICDVHAHYTPKNFSQFMGDRFASPTHLAVKRGLARHPFSDTQEDIDARFW